MVLKRARSDPVKEALLSSRKSVPGCRGGICHISDEEGAYLLLSLALYLLGYSAANDCRKEYIIYKKGMLPTAHHVWPKLGQLL